MIDVLLNALGTVFAGGAGVLLLALVAGAIVILFNWRLALAGVVFIHLGLASVLVHIHAVSGLIAAGQIAAVLLCAAMLGLAGWLQPPAVSLRQAGNWPLRSLALLFIVGAWWFLDPGYTLPYFSLPETELLIWMALCALVLWSFSASPLLGGAAVLLWSTLPYALAAVLLPGSGLAAVVGLADLLIVLACSYLVLLEPPVPGAAPGAVPRFLPRVLPHLRPAGGARPWGLVRRPTQPAAVTAPAPADTREEAASV